MKYSGESQEAKFFPELERHASTWLGAQSPETATGKVGNRCANPGARVMLTESVFECDLRAQTKRVAIRHNMELWKVAVQMNVDMTGAMLSQQDLRRALRHIIYANSEDEDFKLELHVANERILDSRTVSDEDTSTFFRSITNRSHNAHSSGSCSNKEDP